MNDKVFLDAFYWLMMNHDFVLILSSSLVFLSVIITLLLIIKKWGESY